MLLTRHRLRNCQKSMERFTDTELIIHGAERPQLNGMFPPPRKEITMRWFTGRREQDP